MTKQTPGLWDFCVDHANKEALQAERKAWWDKICPTKTRGAPSWKDEIHAWIDEADLDGCTSAAVWFAGSPLDVLSRKDGKVEVYGDGYWIRIGS